MTPIPSPIQQPARPDALERTLAVGVATIALFNTVSGLSMPVLDRKPSPLRVSIWAALLLSHAALYWLGSSFRSRRGTRSYVALQTTQVFAVGLSGMPLPIWAALYLALTADIVRLARNAWTSMLLTTGAIVLFAANAAITKTLYQGATVGLLLAVTGFIARAVAALMQRAPEPPAPPVVTPVPSEPPATPSIVDSTLTDRELEVLRAVIGGARNNQIAQDLGIAERTVKAHLASVYRKLGVESRAAAISVSLRRGWFQVEDSKNS
ncbi:MAG: response regulator transcription factor [bacterium]